MKTDEYYSVLSSNRKMIVDYFDGRVSSMILDQQEKDFLNGLDLDS